MAELRIPFDEINTPKKATSGTRQAFKRAGFDIHRHEIDDLVDDPQKGERILQVRKVKKYFFQGR